MTTQAHGLERLQEYSDNRGIAVQADRAASVIRGVKIIGLASRNGREYLPEALKKATTLYEGKAVNVDHAGKENSRSYRDRIGRLTAVTFREDGLFADLQFNPKHALAEQLLWDAEHAPENVGLSHDAMGRVARRSGKTIVEEIESVRSVDLVADPATTAGLFESTESTESTSESGSESKSTNKQEDTMSTELKEATFEQLRTQRPDLIEQLTRQIAESREAKALQEELKTLREENAKLKAEIEQHARRKTIHEELEAAKLDPADKTQVSEMFFEALFREEDPAQRQALIEDRKTLLASASKTGSPTSGSRYGQNAGRAPAQADRVAAWRE